MFKTLRPHPRLVALLTALLIMGPTVMTMPATALATTDPWFLLANEGKLVGEYLSSPGGGEYTFGMECEGYPFENICYLRVRQNGANDWEGLVPADSGEYPYRIWMTDDGNLLVLDSSWNLIWATNTGGNPGGYLLLGGDGNAAVYNSSAQPQWSVFSYFTGNYCDS